MEALDLRLRQVRVRCGLNLLLERTARTLVAGAGAGFLLVLLERLFAWDLLDPVAIRVCVAAAAVMSLAWWWMGLPSRMQVGLLIDQRLRLRERVSTALALAGTDDPFFDAACAEAVQVIRKIDPSRSFPVSPSRTWWYALGAWALVVGMAEFMPQKDILGLLKDKQEQQQQARQAETVKKDIAQAAQAVKLAAERMEEPNLAKDLASLDQTANTALEPQVAKREAIKKMGDLSDKIKQLQAKPEAMAMEAMQQALKQLRGSPNALSQQLNLALARGDFGKASDLLKDLQNQLLDHSLSDQQRQAIAKQMGDLAMQLQDLAQKGDAMEKEMARLGLDKKLAQLNEQQLREALQRQGLSQEATEQLMQKMAASRTAQGRMAQLAKAMGGAGAQDLSADDLAGSVQQLDELEGLQQQMQLSEAALAEIERAIAALGQGEGLFGPGGQYPFKEGESDAMGPGSGGPGQGFGPRDSATSGDFGVKKTRAKGKSEPAPVIASWYFKDVQVTGEARQEFKQTVQAARDTAAEAINENQIPKKYQDAVKRYFGQLEESSK